MNNKNLDKTFFNGTENYFDNFLLKIKEDNIIKSIKLQDSGSLGEYDLEVFDQNGEFVKEMDLYSVFEYLEENYDFLVTIPEIYKENLLGKGEMIPVSPSDRQDAKGFVGTLGKELLFNKGEKRFIVKLKKNKLGDNYKFGGKTLFPRFTGKDKSFSGVCFLDSSEKLKIGDDYEIIGFFDGEKIIEDLSFYSEEKISEISHDLGKKLDKIFAA